MKTVLCVFGTRPEAIKMAPVILALAQQSEQFAVKVCVTAQHRSMLDQILPFFGLIPDYDLNVMRSGQSLSALTAQLTQHLPCVYADCNPDYILVQGDTTTTFAASLVAFYHKIPVGHIEAGLRTHNRYAPWPEEMNRQLVSALAHLHFAHTKAAASNLIQENIDPQQIVITGNTVIDALLWTHKKIQESPQLQAQLQQQFAFLPPHKKIILVTGHRRENFGSGFEHICQALRQIALQYPLCEIVYPVHLNPNVQGPVKALLSGVANIHLLDPLDYLPFVYLLQRSYFVLTDSGGIQEEAPALGKPVLLMREATERPEGIEAGTIKLVGTQVESILAAVDRLMRDEAVYDAMSHAHNPYGDGTAALKILDALAAGFPLAMSSCFPWRCPSSELMA